MTLTEATGEVKDRKRWNKVIKLHVRPHSSAGYGIP